MSATAPHHRFRLDVFETIDIVDDARARDDLCMALAEAVVSARNGRTGAEGIPDLIAELNALGHRFAHHEQSDPGWATWLQHTNDGTRHFYIHVELDDPASVMVLYDETLDAMVARRSREMTPEDRARDERSTLFYDRGLALVDRFEEYAQMGEPDRLLLCLYLLDTGVSNGGFGTYLTNTEGAHLQDARRFLDEIGARELAGIVGEVMALLPPLGEGVGDALWDALDAHSQRLDELDGRFYDCEERVDQLVMDRLEG